MDTTILKNDDSAKKSLDANLECSKNILDSDQKRIYESGSLFRTNEELTNPLLNPLGNRPTFASFIDQMNNQNNENQHPVVENKDPAFVFQPSIEDKLYFLPPIRADREYTLVLDLDETLVHFEEITQGGMFLVRPYARVFLERVSEFFEIVIFTAATKDYADKILDHIDEKHEYISHRLYRESTTFYNNIYHKDLSKLGRDLSKTIIIDNCMENFRLQPSNGIYIKSWHNDRGDQALLQLFPILCELVQWGHRDVRVALRELKKRLNSREGLKELKYSSKGYLAPGNGRQNEESLENSLERLLVQFKA